MRQVQVFKWIQERDGDGKLQNVRIQDGMATFHQFGAAYAEFENGAGSYAVAIIERADGIVQQVNADMIQFISPPPAAAHIGAEWERISEKDASFSRLRVPTGWLVREINECAHIGNDKNEYITTGYDWRVALAFVPDPDGAWLAAPGGAA